MRLQQFALGSSEADGIASPGAPLGLVGRRGATGGCRSQDASRGAPRPAGRAGGTPHGVPFTAFRRGEPGVWQLVRPGDNCLFLVAVDGHLTDWVEVADLPPMYVLAIETYRRVSQVPIEFMYLLSAASARRMPGANCGVVLVSTRNGR